ncbi:hypothetical protein D3C86_436760 [compost metagenome]
MLRGDPDAGIGDLHPHLLGGRLERDRDRAPLRRELERIAQEIQEDLGNPARIGLHPDGLGKQHGLQREVTVAEDWGKALDGLQDPAREVGLGAGDLERAGLDARKVQKVVHQSGEMLRAQLDLPHEVRLSFRQLALKPILEELGVALNRGQRRAKLVRNHAEEVGLQAFQLHKLIVGLLEFTGSRVDPGLQLARVGLLDLSLRFQVRRALCGLHVLKRNGRLSCQDLQDGEALGREGALEERVLEVEDSEQDSLVHDGKRQNRAGLLGLDVRVARIEARASGVTQEHGRLGSRHVANEAHGQAGIVPQGFRLQDLQDSALVALSLDHETRRGVIPRVQQQDRPLGTRALLGRGDERHQQPVENHLARDGLRRPPDRGQVEHAALDERGDMTEMQALKGFFAESARRRAGDPVQCVVPVPAIQAANLGMRSPAQVGVSGRQQISLGRPFQAAGQVEACGGFVCARLVTQEAAGMSRLDCLLEKQRGLGGLAAHVGPLGPHQALMVTEVLGAVPCPSPHPAVEPAHAPPGRRRLRGLPSGHQRSRLEAVDGVVDHVGRASQGLDDAIGLREGLPSPLGILVEAGEL